MSKAKTKGINPLLEQGINDMLRQVANDPEMTITDKTKVWDRALKLEAIKAKLNDEGWGAAFAQEEDEE
jgi:hypothetical protein